MVKIMKANDRIKVHMYDTNGNEIKTRVFDRFLKCMKITENLVLTGMRKESLTSVMAIYLPHLSLLQVLLFLRMWKQESSIVLAI